MAKSKIEVKPADLPPNSLVEDEARPRQGYAKPEEVRQITKEIFAERAGIFEALAASERQDRENAERQEKSR